MSFGNSPAALQQVDLSQIAQALNVEKRSAERRSKKEAWTFTAEPTRGGLKRIFAVDALPTDIQAALLLRFAPQPAATSALKSHETWSDARVESVWSVFNAASDDLKAQAKQRLTALHAIETLHANGLPMTQARAQVAEQLQRDGESGSVRNLIRWANAVKGAPRDAWLAILLPAYAGCAITSDCNPQAWDWYKGHYLTRKQPSHSSTYRRLKEIADKQGWKIPCARTLERRLDREVASTTQTLMRKGAEALSQIKLHQTRSTAHFAPGEAVNGDGLKFDRLWVRFEDGEILNTATAWFWQDLRTRKILAWRLGKTENTDLFRLATYDLTAVCAPTSAWMDNTRVAANKLMTAGASHRNRYKSDPSDGMGLLQMLGIEPRFTNPDKELGTPGAKPIERAFGIGGIHSEVATNPRLTDRGFSKATAINVAELREVLALEVLRHNAMPGRRNEACRGVLSFDQAWDEARDGQPVRVLPDSQRQLLLMCREVVTVDRTGAVRIAAGRSRHGQNRYWSELSVEMARRKVAVHYDPEALHGDVYLYGLDGRYLFTAQHQATRAYDNKQAGDQTRKLNERTRKALNIAAENTARMEKLERDQLYRSATEDIVPPEPQQHEGANVVTGNFRRVPNTKRDAKRAALPRTGTDDHSPRETKFNEHIRRLHEQRIASLDWTPPQD
jgi:putative transposase